MNEDSKLVIESKPFTLKGTTNRDWWPNQLNLKILNQNCPMSNPDGQGVQLR